MNMTFIPANPTVGGDALNHDDSVIKGTFNAGTEFTITDDGGRGYSLVDDEGNEMHDFGRLGEHYTVVR